MCTALAVAKTKKVGATWKMTGLLTFLDLLREDTAHREDNIFDDTDAVKTAADIVLTRPGLSFIVNGILVCGAIGCTKHTIGLVIDSKWRWTHIAGSHILRSLAERVELDRSAEDKKDD